MAPWGVMGVGKDSFFSNICSKYRRQNRSCQGGNGLCYNETRVCVVRFTRRAGGTTMSGLQATQSGFAEVNGARKIVMPNTTHVPNMEQPEQFNHYVLDFCQVHQADREPFLQSLASGIGNMRHLRPDLAQYISEDGPLGRRAHGDAHTPVKRRRAGHA